MSLGFRKKSIGSLHGVQLTKVKGRKITPVLVYVSKSEERATGVLEALSSGLINRITAALLKEDS